MSFKPINAVYAVELVDSRPVIAPFAVLKADYAPAKTVSAFAKSASSPGIVLS